MGHSDDTTLKAHLGWTTVIRKYPTSHRRVNYGDVKSSTLSFLYCIKKKKGKIGLASISLCTHFVALMIACTYEQTPISTFSSSRDQVKITNLSRSTRECLNKCACHKKVKEITFLSGRERFIFGWVIVKRVWPRLSSCRNNRSGKSFSYGSNVCHCKKLKCVLARVSVVYLAN